MSPTFLDLTIDGGEKFELGYKLLVHIIRRFSLNPQVYIIVVTIIIFGGMYKFIKDNCKGYFSVAIVIYIGLLYYTNFSAIRQCIALAFAVNSYTFLKKRKWVQASIIIIVAGLFHTTAWILLIFIPLSFTEWTRKKIVIAILGSSIGILLFEKVVDIVIKILPVYARYWNGAAMDSSGSSIGIFAILVGFLCVVAIYIIFSAIKLSVQVSKQLLDSRIEEEAYNKLLKVLDSFGSYHLDFHRLRTRSAGNEIFIDMHLTLCRKLTLDEVHQITDVIENAISKEISGADITIHPEPCSHTDNDHGKCNSSRIREGLKKLQK